ncbi:hypothetical protein Tco_0087647 [Tanacetum coccineum]
MGGGGSFMMPFNSSEFLLFFIMAEQFPALLSFANDAYSNKLNNQMKVCFFKEVKSEETFAEGMVEYCSLVKTAMEKREHLMLELKKLAVSEGAAGSLETLKERQENDGEKLCLLRELLFHARGQTHRMQLALDKLNVT